MRIILAVDGSDESQMAASLLTQLPLPESSQITVVTVVVDTPMDEIDAEVWLKVREASRVTALQNYQAVLPKLGALAANAEHLLEEGHPSRVIVEAAKERDADLIVVGARGHSLIARVLLGSTADFVA
ncbi:MAG: universal stress protein, partial [Planctomycetales bacterium]|nr:universal stress protein [Planctomycetales bacterium]